MTKVQTHFRLQRPLDDAMLAQLPSTHTLYGILKVQVNNDGSLTVEYDATRLRPAEVEAAFSAAGIPVTIVPHRTSAEVLTSLLRGDIQIGVESYAALKSAIDAKQIRAIASSGSRRSPQQPDVPTLRESGVDAAVDGWNSLVAPAGTPREIIAFLNGHVRAIIADPDFQKRMIELGGEPVTGSPEELDARLKSDVEMWAAVVKKAGLEPN